MQFTSASVAAFLLSVGGASAFSVAPSSCKLVFTKEHLFRRWQTRSPPCQTLHLSHDYLCILQYCCFLCGLFLPTTAFVSSRVSAGAAPSVISAPHASGCACAACSRRSIVLFADAATETAAEEEVPADVPVEVEALDGVESEDEAHNADRPARKSLKKKGPKGKPLSEFKAGDSLKAKVKALASYGAFLDIGAQTDGLLHISQLSVDYVADVSSMLEVGQEVDVRIVNIDEKKNQVALTLLSEAQEEEAKANQEQARSPRPARSSNRRDDSAVLSALAEKGWDTEAFVEGTVVSTVDFGAFVRVDASNLNSECEGEFDGLVHISALTAGRVNNVESVVKPDDKVQVRVKEIANRKVSLSMVSVEDEKEKQASFGGSAPAPVGNKNWKEDFENMQKEMPAFKNSPMVVDLRK